MRYRLGRSHQDIVYRQLGDEPSDEDPRVAVFTEAIDAIRVVQLLNGDAPPAAEPVVEPPPVDALPPLPPKWTRPAATEARSIADVLAAPQRTVPADDHWDDRPFVEWQAAAIQQVMYRAIDDAHAAGVAEGRRQAAGPVLAEVVAERLRQDARWGEQNHPDGTNLDNAAWRDYSRRLTQRAADEGRVTWAHILQEEFVEALAEVEPARIRAELIQTAAVAVAWVQAIDRRQP